MDKIKILKKNNLQFFTDVVIEMGLLRTKNICALCGKKIDIKDYHIQLCKKCRINSLERYSRESLSEQESGK